jgi:hypothetical protein
MNEAYLRELKNIENSEYVKFHEELDYVLYKGPFDANKKVIVGKKDDINNYYYIEVEKTGKETMNFFKRITRRIMRPKIVNDDNKRYIKIKKVLNKKIDEEDNHLTNKEALLSFINDKDYYGFDIKFKDIKDAVLKCVKADINQFLKLCKYKIKEGVEYKYNDNGDLIITITKKSNSSSLSSRRSRRKSNM